MLRTACRATDARLCSTMPFPQLNPAFFSTALPKNRSATIFLLPFALVMATSHAEER